MKRDFKKKYKRTVLGAVWSLLSPLMMLLVMRLVFTQFFGRSMDHYTTYLFCGNLVFAFFNESTSQGMSSLMGNTGIFTQLLMYMSAIFYSIETYSPNVQNLFLLNPVYLFIRYFREIVINMTVPPLWFHALMLADTLIAVRIGCFMYKKYNHRFLYYV